MKSKCILILGMHRSGTSCLAGSLSKSGVYLGNVSQKNKFNLKGNQEGSAVAINDNLLRMNNASWFEPAAVSRVPLSVIKNIIFYSIVMNWGRYKNNYKYWGIKDPRMVFCQKAWNFKNKNLIGTFRRPDLVVNSLRRRDSKLNYDQALGLWYKYNEAMLDIYRERTFPIVNFDWEATKYLDCIKRILTEYGLTYIGEDFFDTGLRNMETGTLNLPDKYTEIFSELNEISERELAKLR